MLVETRVLRATVLFTLAALSAIILTGCDDLYNFGPYALGLRSDGNLVVESCEQRVVTDVYVEQLQGQQRKHIWEASGYLNLQPGGQMIIGGENPGLRNSLVLPGDPIPGTRYFVNMNKDASDVVTSALFTIPDSGLRVGQWLDPRGNMTDRPCVKS